jgi:hypothetical protein
MMLQTFGRSLLAIPLSLLRWRAPLVVAFLMSLAACSATSASPAAPTRPATQTRPTAIILPAGTLLFHSDWSHGFAGRDGAAGWRIVHGALQSDVRNNNVLKLPYMPVVPNYALEVRFQIASVAQNGGYFIVTAGRTRSKDGYTAGILNLLGSAPRSEFANPQVQVNIDPLSAMDSNVVVSDYEPGTLWHTYRIEVRGSQVAFFIDDLRKSFATSNDTNLLSDGPLRLISAGAVVRISTVRITAL